MPASDPLDWSKLAFQLELDGIARQVVLHSVVELYDEQQLRLAFAPELELMLKPDIKNQIKASIERKLSVSLAVEFEARSPLKAETPQKAHQRKQEEDRRQAIVRIRDHNMVQKLNRLFNAQLIEASVKKHNSQ